MGEESRLGYHMISPVGSELLQELLQEIGRSADKLADVELTGFLATRGAAYVGELMWIGRDPPGTGKTAFAHWLVDQVEVPLIVRCGSDLMSPYVGLRAKHCFHVS